MIENGIVSRIVLAGAFVGATAGVAAASPEAASAPAAQIAVGAAPPLSPEDILRDNKLAQRSILGLADVMARRPAEQWGEVVRTEIRKVGGSTQEFIAGEKQRVTQAELGTVQLGQAPATPQDELKTYIGRKVDSLRDRANSFLDKISSGQISSPAFYKSDIEGRIPYPYGVVAEKLFKGELTRDQAGQEADMMAKARKDSLFTVVEHAAAPIAPATGSAPAASVTR